MKAKDIYQFLSPKYQNLFLDYRVDLKPRKSVGGKSLPHPELYKIIDRNRNSYESLLKRALDFKESVWSIKDSRNEKDTGNPVWNNGFLPGLDIILIYTLLTEYKPKKYVEIGSGNSTKVAFKAKQEQNLKMEITSIDPSPRAEIDAISDVVIRHPFENIDINVIDLLEENDVLFVDNSHRILPNSDAMVFFLEILPRLKKGVIVHLHDIYLPYDYPQNMCDRGYSEQYGLAMFLLANSNKYETLMPNYFIHSDDELSSVIAPIWDHPNLQNVEKHGGSYWLRIAN